MAHWQEISIYQTKPRHIITGVLPSGTMLAQTLAPGVFFSRFEKAKFFKMYGELWREDWLCEQTA